MSRRIILLLAIIAYYQVTSQPVSSEKSIKCYDRECPNETTGCKRDIRTSEDKKFLSTIISCLDMQDMVLKDYIENKENPYGPSTTFQSTSFAGTYTSHIGGPVDINIDNHVGPRLEDFN